jgi:hypothetical protein
VSLSFALQAEKKYAIQGEQGETLYWAKESSSCGPRWCLANIRPLHISLQDQTGREVALIRRPLNCMGCCCNGLCYPHCTQKAAVSVEGKEAGFVRERATWCYPVHTTFKQHNGFIILDNCLLSLDNLSY